MLLFTCKNRRLNKCFILYSYSSRSSGSLHSPFASMYLEVGAAIAAVMDNAVIVPF